jgi:hypothetical protein
MTEEAQGQSFGKAPAPKTSENLSVLVGTLPSVNQRHPLWVREEGRKRLHLTIAERAAREENARQRAAYQAVLDGFQVGIHEVSNMEHNAGIQDDQIRRYAQIIREAEAKERVDEANSLLGKIVLAELAILMKDSQFVPTARRVYGVTITQFTNRYGTFELYFNSKRTLFVTPANKKLKPLQVTFDEEGLPLETVLVLKGYLALDADVFTQRVRLLLFSDPESDEQFTDDPEDRMLHTVVGCTDPGCKYHNGQ